MNNRVCDSVVMSAGAYSSRRKSAKSILFLIGLLLAEGLLVTSCSEEWDGDMAQGYFQTLGSKAKFLDVSAEAGEMQISMCGTETESVIPIVSIAIGRELMGSEHLWDDYEKYGWMLQPATVYKAAGYSSYPNTLDMEYQFEWVKCASYKYPGSSKGVLQVKYEKYTGTEPRTITIYLRNEDAGFLVLTQWPENGTEAADENQPE